MKRIAEPTCHQIQFSINPESCFLFFLSLFAAVLQLATVTISVQAEETNKEEIENLSSGQDTRPNILFIYTDDQSYRTVSCYPDAYPWVQTPNLDHLARQGVRFEHAYIGSWCMPSRASMLTGLHQHGIESMRMEGKYPGSAYDPKQCKFWPSVLRQNGYTTAHIGKWHTGRDTGFGRDWDHQIVWNRPGNPDNAPNYYDNQLINFNGKPAELVKGYSTDNYTEWAIEFIESEKQSQKPWYLWLCYGAVHGPFTPANRHLESYPTIEVPVPVDIYPPRAGKPKYVQEMQHWEPGKDGFPAERKTREVSPVGMKDMPGRSLKDWIRQYHQGVLAIDEGVGRILESLKDSGQDEDTLIIFTSDQGFAWGQHGFKSKVAPYRATVEAPLIIRPAKSHGNQVAGQVITSPVSGVDIPPTILSHAEVELPWTMHGEDLSPLLAGRTTRRSQPAMLVHTGAIYGSETDTIPDVDDPRLYHGPGVPWYVMLASGKYKYVRNLVSGETEELYDLAKDPNELKNLASKKLHQRRLRRMRLETRQELQRTSAGFVNQMPKTLGEKQ